MTELIIILFIRHYRHYTNVLKIGSHFCHINTNMTKKSKIRLRDPVL